MATEYCIVCDEGELHTELYSDSFQNGNKQIRVDGLHRSRCSLCGADPVLPEQARLNQVLIADAKRREEGLLSGAEIRRIREKLRLSQPQAAELFGGGANAFSKYERGDVLQSAAMDRLLRVVSAYPFVISALKPKKVTSFAVRGVFVRGNLTNVSSEWEDLNVHQDRTARFAYADQADIVANQPEWTTPAELEVA
nr:type II toxin-antitoxin system MqsA family antitoxin [uncultured Steroidobacter sp.]